MRHKGNGHSTKNSRIAYLDGLRGIAILTVVAVHWGQHAGGLFGGGYLGVDIFFVISGYVITSILMREQIPYRTFLLRRARRLLPALGGLLVAGVVLTFIIPGSQISGPHALKNAVIAATEASSIYAASGGNIEPFGITWSLAAEWYFYLVWPLALGFIVRRTKHRRSARRIILSVAATLYLGSLALPGGWFYFGPTARIAELLVGAAVASYVRQHSKILPMPLLIVAAFGCAAWIASGVSYMSLAYRLCGLPLAVATTAAFIVQGKNSPKSLIIRWLGARYLAGIGLASYSIYLWHTVPLAIFPQGAFGIPRPMLALAGMTFALGGALASYRWLERPFTNSRGSALMPRNQEYQVVDVTVENSASEYAARIDDQLRIPQ